MKRNRETEQKMKKNIAHNQNRKRAKFAAIKPSDKAKAAFKHDAYKSFKSGELLRVQGVQMEHDDVLGYLEKKGFGRD